MFNGARGAPGLPAAGAYEQRRLSEVISGWLQRELTDATLGVSSTRPEAAGAGGAAAEPRGPFYAPLFLRERTLATPPIVQQLKASCRVSWNVKAFVSIKRAAAFADDQLFLWNYLTGRDPVMYQAGGVVTAAEVVRPRPGVFAPHVHFLLVVATVSSVELVALHVSDRDMDQVLLQKLPEYRLSLGNVLFGCIAAYDVDGDASRVFVGGNDGCVYELEYCAADGWLQARMRLKNLTIPLGGFPVLADLVYKVRENVLAPFADYGGIRDVQVDGARRFLYCLDAKGCVSMWWLGGEGDASRNDYQCIAPACEPNGPRPVSLHPVAQQRELLCVLLEDGRRLHFSLSTSLEGRQQLQVRPAAFNSKDLSASSLRAMSTQALAPVSIGPLAPAVPLGRVGELAVVDDACRSCVAAKESLLIPKNHQENPQLVCTASLAAEGSQGNVLSVVDLSPLIGMADGWRRGEHPTVGINVFGVVEDEWAGSVLQTGAGSDLVWQVIRPPPRYLVVHSVGITVLTRLRPADLLHISLLYPNPRDSAALAQQLQVPHDQLRQLDFGWLLATYGKVEVAVMLLTLICGDVRSARDAPAGFAGPSEELVAQTLLANPSQDVLQRAHEQFIKLGPEGHAALFKYFTRTTLRLWTTSFVLPFWEHMWSRRLFRLFIAPLEGLLRLLRLLVPPDTSELHCVWNPHTDVLKAGSAVCALMSGQESYARLSEELQKPETRPDLETLKAVEALSRRGLLGVVQRTVEALKILRALEDVTPAERRRFTERIRSIELHAVVTSQGSEEGRTFAEALMEVLLSMPHAVDSVWGAWRECTCFFDPAAVGFYEARKRILSPHSNPQLIQQSLLELQLPEVAPCLLQPLQGAQAAPAGGGDAQYRLEIICSDLRKAQQHLGAMRLAAVAAQHCDPDDRGEAFHATVVEAAAGGAAGGAQLSDAAALDRLNADSNCHFFNARRVAYHEIVKTLLELCGSDNAADTAAARAHKAAAIEWAFGHAAGRYYDGGFRGAARPVLAGELFQGSDRLLHYHIYAWLATRQDADGVWPTRSDLSRIRPARPTQQTAPNTLQHFLAAGRFAEIAAHPVAQWVPQMVAPWTSVWDGWHIGLLSDLAEYCDRNGEYMFASCTRLALANASSALMLASPDYQNCTNLLVPRIDILVNAEAAASQEASGCARSLVQWLRQWRPSAVARVQLDMLRELPEEAWNERTIGGDSQLAAAAARDEAELRNELLQPEKLYEMLHDSYDEAVPHLAIKLLRIMGVERPELKHIFASTSHVGPYTVNDFVSKLIEHHRRYVRRDGVNAIRECFQKLQDAAGLDQGTVYHTQPPFMPLQLVLSGLEEMAMQVLDRDAGSRVVPEGDLEDYRWRPVSVVPQIVGPALGWPNSRVLYDVYRLLWTNVSRGQMHEMFQLFRGTQVEDQAVHTAVRARLVGILAQYCLQWIERSEQDVSAGGATQQLGREHLIFSEDIEQMASSIEGQPGIPQSIRSLVHVCRQRLKKLVSQIQSSQPSVPPKEW